MSIRVPQKPGFEVTDIRFHLSSDNFTVSRLMSKKNGTMSVIWEPDSEGDTSTFLDCFGEIFYDVNGEPFQGSD